MATDPCNKHRFFAEQGFSARVRRRSMICPLASRFCGMGRMLAAEFPPCSRGIGGAGLTDRDPTGIFKGVMGSIEIHAGCV